jgi:TM2 domain-containing membrane protein YozV
VKTYTAIGRHTVIHRGAIKGWKEREVSFKLVAVLLSCLLLGNGTLLFGADAVRTEPGAEQTDLESQSFYRHLSIHDYRQYGIPQYQPFGNNGEVPPRKDPFIAGLLSWFMMGVGQIYAQEYWKGSVFIAVSLTNKVLLVLLLSYINSKYGVSDQIVSLDWNSFDAGDKFLIVLYLAESLGLRIYNVVDAVHSAQRFNERYENQDAKGLSVDLDGDRLSIEYYFWFND